MALLRWPVAAGTARASGCARQCRALGVTGCEATLAGSKPACCMMSMTSLLQNVPASPADAGGQSMHLYICTELNARPAALSCAACYRAAWCCAREHGIRTQE